tara:strand:+ start:1011 stop:1421 length:411 start_codon:yes stop_codon:yes gene_type:complete
MNVRRLKESDWDMLQEWWSGWPGWTPPDKEFLPENGTGGLIVEKEGRPIVAGFIFLGIGLKIAYFGWIVSDPKYRDKDRILAIEVLIKKAEEFCRSIGKTYLNSFVNKRNPVLLEAHKKLGWDISKETSHELTKIL